MLVLPVLRQSREEVVPRNHQHAAFLQALVELRAGDGKPGKPQPQEDRAFGLVDGELKACELTPDPVNGLVGFVPVEGPDELAADVHDLAALDHFHGQGRAESAGGKIDDSIDARQAANDLLIGNYDTRAHSRKSQLGKTHAEDHVVVPDRDRMRKNDLREWRAVGTVEDQRYVVPASEHHELRDLVVGEHVAGRIRGARHANGADVVADGQLVEVHVIFEKMIVEALDGRPIGGEHACHDALIGIADVFGCQRQKNTPRRAAIVVSREHVEEHEGGGLAAVGYRDIVGAERPPELAPQKPGERRDESRFALGRIVVADEALESIAVIENVAHALAKTRLHLRNSSRISAAEHEHALVDGQGVAEIVHELDDAGIAAEAFTEAGEFHDGATHPVCAHCSG